MNKKVSQESLVGIGSLIVSGVGLLAKYSPQIVAALKNKSDDSAGGKAIQMAKDALRSSTTSDLVRFTQSARVEPILLMDKRAVNIPFIQDVVHSLYNMFTGYWLLAVSLDTKINGVSVGRRLDKFATDRDLAEATLTLFDEDTNPSMESFGLPFIKEIIEEQDRVSMESVDLDPAELAAEIQKAIDRVTDQRLKEKLAREYEKVKAGTDKAASAKAKEMLEEFKKRNFENKGQSVQGASKYVEKINNLAVGNVIDVTISEDGKTAVVPVTIRLRVAGMPSETMVQTLAVGGKDATMRSRWRAWRAGEIRFWADFVLAMDRVDAHRAAMMNDESGYYKTVYGRAQKNTIAEGLAQGPSLSSASSLLVLDSKTAAELERRVNGRLDNFKTRQGIFGHTYSMLMAVVDPDWESVTIYTRGIEMPTQLTARDIKTAGKSDSKELMDILKSYSLGKAPGRI